MTPIVWRNDRWNILQYSKHSRRPYHTREQIDIYPTPAYTAASKDETNKLAVDLINLQIRSALAVIDPNGLGSPHHPRNIELRTST
jgi:hypothetical protein